MLISLRRSVFALLLVLCFSAITHAAKFPCGFSLTTSQNASQVTVNYTITNGDGLVLGSSSMVRPKPVDPRIFLDRILFETRERCLAQLQDSDLPASLSRTFTLMDLYQLPETFSE